MTNTPAPNNDVRGLGYSVLTTAPYAHLDLDFDFHVPPTATEAKHIRAAGRKLFDILGRPSHGKFMYESVDGWRYGRSEAIQPASFTDHLLGRKTLAVSPIQRGRATFFCVDVDERFEARLPIIADALYSAQLLHASFATTGSSVGRGKVIIVPAEPVPQAIAFEIVKQIVTDMRAHPGFGADSEGFTVTTFPNRGAAVGNVVRILGRNIGRGGSLESLIGFDGTRVPLSGAGAVRFLETGVMPIPLRALYDNLHFGLSDSYQMGRFCTKPDSYRSTGDEKGDSYRPFAEVVDRLLTEPYRGNGDTIRDDMARLARFAHIRAGDGGEALFDGFCDQLLDHADDATAGARDQLRRPDVRERTWALICRTPSFAVTGERTPNLVGDWQPLQRDEVDAPARAWRAYDAAVTILLRCRKNPHAFSLALSQWCQQAAYADKAPLYASVLAAEKAQLLIRLDKGEPRRQGDDGDRAIVGLVGLRGKGETIDDVIRSAAFSNELAERVAARSERGLTPIMSLISTPVLA